MNCKCEMKSKASMPIKSATENWNADVCCRATVRLDVGQRGSLCPSFSMSAVRPPVFIGLLLLILTTGYCKPRDRDDASLLELLMDRVRQTQEHHSEGNTQHPPQIIEHSLETKDVNKVTKSYQHERILGKHHHMQWLPELFRLWELAHTCRTTVMALHFQKNCHLRNFCCFNRGLSERSSTEGEVFKTFNR